MYRESAPLDSENPSLEPLAPGEWHVLACVYELGSANPKQVSEQLRRKNREDLSPKTCGIYLARVALKGYLSADPEHRPQRGRPLNTYRPAVGKQTALGVQVERFLANYILDAEAHGMLAALIASSRPASTS